MASALFSPTLDVGLWEVRAISVPLDGGERKFMLQHMSKEKLIVQSGLAHLQSQSLVHMSFMVDGCVKYFCTSWWFVSVL